MEENQSNKQVQQDIPLEELRARYGMKRDGYMPFGANQPSVVPHEASTEGDPSLDELRARYGTKRGRCMPFGANQPSVVPHEASNEGDPSLDELRVRYGTKKTPHGNSRMIGQNENQGAATSSEALLKYSKHKRTGVRLTCDILLLAVVLLISLLTALFFATPTTEIGGQTFYGETQNIYDFVWGADNSIIKQMKEAIEQLSGVDIDSSNPLSAVSSVMKIVRLVFLLIPAILVVIKTVISFLEAIYYFFAKKSIKLGSAAVNTIAQNLIVYVFFVFFGSISGGVGEDAYFVGYTVGSGMTVGMLIGLALVLAVSIVTYRINKEKKEAEGFDTWIKALSAGVGYMCIAAVLTFMRIYSVFVYVFSSSLSTAILSIQNGFEIKTLVFPVLNLFLFVVCLHINGRVTKGFTGAFQYLLSYGEKKKLGAKAYKEIEQTLSMNFVSTIVLSVLSVGAVYVLRNPTFGYGWSVNIYQYFVYIFMIASIAQTVLSVFADKKKKEES